uniref:Secreted protein n=1 Tax=Anopheles coluzzii TaxID=1518534 RepID=A0A8W7PDJ8_ANOCL
LKTHSRRSQEIMQLFVTVLLCVVVTNCVAHSTNLALFTPYVPVHPLDEGYFPRTRYFENLETGLLQEHPIVRFPDTTHSHPYFPTEPLLHFPHQQSLPQQHFHQPTQHQQDLFLPDDRYLSFIAPSSPLVAYVPVHRGKPGPWAVPNVFIKGQGYSTNHYVAPALMKKVLAQDPR